MSDENFASKLRTLLALQHLQEDDFRRMMSQQTGKHRTTIGGWLLSKSSPNRTNKRIIERVLNVPEGVFDLTIAEIRETVQPGKYRIKQSPALDNAKLNKEFLGEYVMFRYTFSNYGTDKTYFIRSTIKIDRVGPTVYFDCIEPRYPFEGEVDFSDRNIAFISVRHDSGFRLNMLVDKIPLLHHGNDYPKYTGIIMGTSYMETMRLCATNVLLIKREDYEHFCRRHSLEGSFDAKEFSNSDSCSSTLPPEVIALGMKSYFDGCDKGQKVIKAS